MTDTPEREARRPVDMDLLRAGWLGEAA